MGGGTAPGSDDPATATGSRPSSTYLLTSLGAFLDSVTYRMLADGMILQDIQAAAATITAWSEWGAFWTGRAHDHGQRGDQALAAGSIVTAAEHFLRASLCAHYGQFLYFDFPDEKLRAVALKVDLFGRAAPLLAHPAIPLEVPFDGGMLPAYLRCPAGGGPFPTVILVGGLDAAKEDATQFATLCLERSCAVVAFDGPGQGESFAQGSRFSASAHEAISAVVDALANVPEVDSSAVGVVGRSLGGYLAPRAAAEDTRIAACVAWGALYDLGNLDDKPPLIRSGYHYVTGEADRSRLDATLADVTLAGRATEIACPTLVVHGSRDNSVPVAQARRLAEEARGELWVFEGSIHCCHDVSHIVRPAMADWMAQQLRRRRGVPRR